MDFVAIVFSLFILILGVIAFYGEYKKQRDKNEQKEYSYMVVYFVPVGTGKINLKLKNKPVTYKCRSNG